MLLNIGQPFRDGILFSLKRFQKALLQIKLDELQGFQVPR